LSGKAESTGSASDAGYLRWRLTGNPFSLLSSESIEDVVSVHVPTSVDREFTRAVEEGIRRGRVVILSGEFGSGKTERLRYLAFILTDVNRFYVKVDSDHAEDVIKKILSTIGGPMAAREIRGPEQAGKRAIQILERRKPALLMLDEIENVVVAGTPADSDAFGKFLLRIARGLSPGIGLVLACTPAALDRIRPIVKMGVLVRTRPLSQKEAMEMLSKRMASFRPEGVSVPWPSYPLTEELIQEMNRRAGGNPRRLLKLARLIISRLSFMEVTPDYASRLMEFLQGPTPRVSAGGVQQRVIDILRERGRASLLELSKGLDMSLSDTLRLIGELVKKGVVERCEDGRYRIKTGG